MTAQTPTTANEDVVQTELSLLQGCTGEPIDECDIDGMMKYTGEIGRYQIILTLVLSLFMVAPTYQDLLIVFIGEEPPWRCSNYGNLTGTCNITGSMSPGMDHYEDRCTMESRSWEFAEPISFSIVSQFNLVCDRSALTYFASSAYYFGALLGAVPVGWSSDRFGRIKIILVSYTVALVFAALGSVSNNIWVFMLCRCICGACFTGVTMVTAMVTEFVGTSYRAAFNVVAWYLWTTGICMLSLQAYFVRSWQTLTLITSAPYLILVAFYRWLPDSVRWLRLNKGPHASMKVLRRIAKWNNREIPAHMKLSSVARTSKPSKLFDGIFFPIPAFGKSIFMCVIWAAIALNYYGMSLTTSALSGNLYRDFVFLGLVEIASYAITPSYANRIGRRRGNFLAMLGTGVFLALVGVLPFTGVSDYGTGRVVLGMMAKFTTTLSYNLIYIWSFELYPTAVRCQALSVFEAAATVGSILSPWVGRWLATLHPELPFFSMAGISILASFTCLFLAETKEEATQDI